MKYVKKAIVIEAIQWTGKNYVEISQFCDKSYFDIGLKISTLEGTHKATIGDFIIKGIKGEFYPCKEEIFNLSYDLVEEHKNPLFQKTLHNTTANEATKNGQDGSWGDGDTFKLISKASSEAEGWMKSTKAMEIESIGCIIQTTTQQRNPDGSYSLCDTTTFVKDVKISEQLNSDNEVVSRKLKSRFYL
jgi:hypothetical protein